MSKSSIGVNQP